MNSRSNSSEEIQNNRDYFEQYFEIRRSRLTKFEQKNIGIQENYPTWKFECAFIDTSSWIQIDHIEIYKCGDGSTIVIISPYDKQGVIPPHWQESLPLYNGCTSYFLHYHKSKPITFIEDKEYQEHCRNSPNQIGYNEAKTHFESLQKI